MCLDEQSCLFVIGAAQNSAVLADVHGVNLCVSQMAGSIMRQTRLPAPACRELYKVPVTVPVQQPSRPVSRTDATVGSDSDDSETVDYTAETTNESPDAFLVRTQLRELGIVDEQDVHRLGERALAIGRRSFLRAMKELSLERPRAKTVPLALSRILTRYEC